jgi:hypothetical protein
MAYAVIAGISIAGIAFFSAVGFRPDIDRALESYRFLFKFVITITLVVSSSLVLFRIGRPGLQIKSWGWGLLAAVVLIALGVAAELTVMPPDSWSARMIGHNSHLCLTLIPFLSLGPLVCFLHALRRSAPEKPGLAGAIAGLAAAGIAATFYAANCNDDSPLFVTLWYPIAIGMVTATGALIGRWLLRW